MPAQSLTIHNGPVRLRATSYGDGRPVLLLHAGMERRTGWQPVAEGLARSGYRTIAMDQRGHGDSDRVPAATASRTGHAWPGSCWSTWFLTAPRLSA